MQLLLKTLLDAQLADVVGAAVVAFFVAAFYALFFRLVDAADVTHHMAGQLSVGIVAKQPRLDVHPRKTKTLGSKPGHLFVTQAGADGQGLKTLGLVAQLLEAALVPWLDIHQLPECLNGFFQVPHLGGRDLQRVSRVIGRQDNAVAVQNQAAVRHNGDHRRAIGLGLLVQVFMPHDLQINQPGSNQNKSEKNRQTRNQHPRTKARQVSFDVAQFSHASATRRGPKSAQQDRGDAKRADQVQHEPRNRLRRAAGGRPPRGAGSYTK